MSLHRWFVVVLVPAFALLIACAALAQADLPVHAQAAGSPSVPATSFPSSPDDDPTTALARFEIIVHPQFRPLMAGYPGYSGNTSAAAGGFRLHLDELYDPTLLLAHSAAFTHTAAVDQNGAAVGLAGVSIGDRNLVVQPAGFQGPAGTRELHTEIRSLNLYDTGSTAVRVQAGSALALPISPGEVESQSGASGDPQQDFPADSFYDLYAEFVLPPSLGFSGGTVYNADALLLSRTGIAAFPPRAVYLERNSQAVPLLVRDTITTVITLENGDVVTQTRRAGDVFGWIVQAGLGVGYSDSPQDKAEFAQAMQGQQPLAAPCYDFDGDGQVSFADLIDVAARWNLAAANPDPDGDPATPNFEEQVDLDNDGRVGIADIMLLTAAWGQQCPSLELAPGSVVINEVMPRPGLGQAAWAELLNRGGAALSLRGAILADLDGNQYSIPQALPDVPPDSFLVISFDGLGSGQDDYDFSDGVAHLHSTAAMLNPFADSGDQLAFFRVLPEEPETLLDFLAWGADAGTDDDLAVTAGLWTGGAFLAAEQGGMVTGTTVPGVSIGLLPGQRRGLIEGYPVYAAGEMTPGEPNGLPSSSVALPPDGAAILRQTFDLGWYSVPGAIGYELQIDDDSGFASPEVVVVTEPRYSPSASLADGTYFWRTRAVSAAGWHSPFSRPVSFTVVTAEPLLIPAVSSEDGVRRPDLTATAPMTTAWISGTIPVPALLQRKDTRLVCWDGDTEASYQAAGGFNYGPWDAPHNDGPASHATHGYNYCARASIAMINRRYGGDLSQDRITYQLFGQTGGIGSAHDGDPAGDLGHFKPTNVADVAPLLSWALNNIVVVPNTGKPTFNQIKGWTTAGVPVVFAVPGTNGPIGHAIVLRGYGEYVGSFGIPFGQWVVYNDPWLGSDVILAYDTLNISFYFEPVPPPDPVTGRMQEASVTTDSDNDGLMDFDEDARFSQVLNDLLPNTTDSDGDSVTDKVEMHGWLYRPHGSYQKPPAQSDLDGDLVRMELDNDSDGGSIADGVEDVNLNGHFDAAMCELDNFNPNDDRPIPTPGPSSVDANSAPSSAYCSFCTSFIYNYPDYTEIRYSACSCNPSNSCRPWICSHDTGICSEFSRDVQP